MRTASGIIQGKMVEQVGYKYTRIEPCVFRELNFGYKVVPPLLSL